MAIQGGRISTDDILDSAITTAKIADDAVESEKIGANEVLTAAILDANVTNAKLGTDISAAKLTAGTVPDARFPATLPAANGSALTNLNAGNLTTGTVATARLGTGTANSTVFLRGDSTFAAPASTGIDWQSSVVTASTITVVAGRGYWINTTSNTCTITLPSSANVGDELVFTDFARTWNANAVTIDPQTLNFKGGSGVITFNTKGQSINIVYSGATQGWIPNTDTNYGTGSYSADLLVVGGAGSGGYIASAGEVGGGGGAGGFRTSTQTISRSTVYTITVGAGGAGGTSNNNGSTSSISGSGLTTITSAGGGKGGIADGSNGADGGSGGGGASASGTSGGSGNTPSTSPSQGNKCCFNCWCWSSRWWRWWF